MTYFHFANNAKKIISFVLLMIIIISTVTYAEVDIDALYNKVISDKSFMTKLYDAGAGFEEPISNEEINTRVKSFITYVMNNAVKQLGEGKINSTNYETVIKNICKSVIFQMGDTGLQNLALVAFPDAIDALLAGRIPVGMEQMYDSLNDEIYKQLGLNSKPEPPKPPTGGGGIGSGGGTAPVPTIVPTLPPVDVKIFNDLQDVQWAETAINTLAEAGVISKNSEMKFNPLNNVKREEFVKLIVSGFDLKNPNATSDFTDVDKTSWFYPYVSSMAMLDLVKGYNNSFGAGQDITRQDIAVLLYRIIQYIELDITPSEPVLFKDDAKINDYAKNAVYAMRQMGIIKGTPENEFEPTSFATRAEAAQMIYNTYKIYIAKK